MLNGRRCSRTLSIIFSETLFYLWTTLQIILCIEGDRNLVETQATKKIKNKEVAVITQENVDVQLNIIG